MYFRDLKRYISDIQVPTHKTRLLKSYANCKQQFAFQDPALCYKGECIKLPTLFADTHAYCRVHQLMLQHNHYAWSTGPNTNLRSIYFGTAQRVPIETHFFYLEFSPDQLNLRLTRRPSLQATLSAVSNSLAMSVIQNICGQPHQESPFQ